MGFGFSNWQEFGVDPILLGQPKFWITTADPAYMVSSGGTSPITSNQVISGFTRYTDKLFNPVTTTTTGRAFYQFDSGQPHSNAYAYWPSSAGTTQGQYSVGSTTDFSFMHQNTGKFTIYWIFKNETGESNASSKFQLSTTQSTGNRGFIMYLANQPSAAFRTFALDIRNDTGGINCCTVRTNHTYLTANNNPIKLISFRGDLTVGIGNNAITAYINGVQDGITIMSNSASTTAASFSTLRVGNRALGDGRFNGKMGEIIIFNTMHDEATHLKVCNHLKDKWRIS